MASEVPCSHKIRILNFNTKDAVMYPIIRILGRVECNKDQITCQKTDDFVNVYSETSNSIPNIHPNNGTFKSLVELNEGGNELRFVYGCHEVSLSLEYCQMNFPYSVMPMYVICEGHDALFQAPSTERNDIKSACDRILLCSKLLQCFTAEKLLENGLGRKTFHLENQCQVFNSKLNYIEARKMSQEQLWKAIGGEIMTSSFASKKRKYLAFLSCTHYNGAQYSEAIMKSHEDLLSITEGYVALGGGGLALFGTGCLYTWPGQFQEIQAKFQDETIVDKGQFLDDSCYRGTRGGCFSTTVGSALHELYHTFDLGHTENGVMGRGFDNINKFFVADSLENVSIRNHEAKIEFKEEFESEVLSQRLVSESRKKDFEVIRKFEENDKTTLTKSCCITLAYHKWFNNYNEASVTLSYDDSNKFIKSTAGIRVVEIRKQPEEMICNYWTFEGRVLKFSFRIPNEVLEEDGSEILFVEDNFGNTLKRLLTA
ncbi:uncharacterized protein [Euwallacea similis]|uniref:uncharacterized protein n=1 Tax=Euwallacea similis TaxID=1736056 RepID=UPI00345072F9